MQSWAGVELRLIIRTSALLWLENIVFFWTTKMSKTAQQRKAWEISMITNVVFVHDFHNTLTCRRKYLSHGALTSIMHLVDFNVCLNCSAVFVENIKQSKRKIVNQSYFDNQLLCGCIVIIPVFASCCIDLVHGVSWFIMWLIMAHPQHQSNRNVRRYFPWGCRIFCAVATRSSEGSGTCIAPLYSDKGRQKCCVGAWCLCCSHTETNMAGTSQVHNLIESLMSNTVYEESNVETNRKLWDLYAQVCFVHSVFTMFVVHGVLPMRRVYLAAFSWCCVTSLWKILGCREFVCEWVGQCQCVKLISLVNLLHYKSQLFSLRKSL